MELWGWLIAYLIGFALLQLYLYRYFIDGRSTDSTESTTPRFEGGAATIEQADGTTGRPETKSDDVVSCTQCGGYNANDATFTYCKHCGEQLT